MCVDVDASAPRAVGVSVPIAIAARETRGTRRDPPSGKGARTAAVVRASAPTRVRLDRAPPRGERARGTRARENEQPPRALRVRGSARSPARRAEKSKQAPFLSLDFRHDGAKRRAARDAISSSVELSRPRVRRLDVNCLLTVAGTGWSCFGGDRAARARVPSSVSRRSTRTMRRLSADEGRVSVVSPDGCGCLESSIVGCLFCCHCCSSERLGSQMAFFPPRPPRTR